MGNMVYSLLWVLQDLYHQPYYVIVAEMTLRCTDTVTSCTATYNHRRIDKKRIAKCGYLVAGGGGDDVLYSIQDTLLGGKQ